MMKFLDLLWRYIELIEARLSRDGEDDERARIVAEMQAALTTLALTVPTVDELRAEWAEAEKRGRARVHADEPPKTEGDE